MDGWQIILFYNNSMNFSFCHLRQSEFLLVPLQYIINNQKLTLLL